MTKATATTAAPLAQASQRSEAESVSTSAPWSSATVLRGQKSVSIEHQGAVYRLQVTKLGKLILTK
ncbi:MAG: hemin uptake protein HemP [Gammaproteobacteria bacterium]|uniref:hemin uptake protein HemP n=1 Tax=Rhodoferax sp. TaxID=50421 RepID=UPI001D2AF02E|nr:hemin uptake protein HemP [Rhodoferax sp.]MBU3897891.1 hemin uptake protein HemP [Gammaproteobacteria bacterium]MBU3998873.1 hemin uptake protein HemP [Gammaproteobacteria bacterium]MBU4019462.1 hemin uptake protein HemP [Gammaproteobacteria bacterium]MBU4080784.1 hemin uptake protein HemP [Gammaproteobacteria bacterium]MBU4113307.1 hemin uptake protein HemP [Gammaproteobacteria bacterium]